MPMHAMGHGMELDKLGLPCTMSVFLLDTSYYRAFCHQHHPASPRILLLPDVFLLSNKIRGDAGGDARELAFFLQNAVNQEVAYHKGHRSGRARTALCYVMYCCVINVSMYAQSCFVLRALFVACYVTENRPSHRPPRKVDDGSPRITHYLMFSTEENVQCNLAKIFSPV